MTRSLCCRTNCLSSIISWDRDIPSCSASPLTENIPQEILSAIFEYGKCMCDDLRLNVEERRFPFEIHVSHVGSFFRSVALANPRLWTSIDINASSSLEWVSEIIRRSGSCGLDVRIELSIGVTQMDDKDLGRMMDLILPQCHRWRSLCVQYGYESVNHPVIMRLSDISAPGLQHLSIEVNDVERVDLDAIRDTMIPRIFKQGTSKLKFVRLRGLALHFFRPKLDTVITLHLDQTMVVPLPYSTFRGIVTCSPSLTNLSISGDVIGRSPWPGKAGSIYLPNLLSLRIRGDGGEIYSGLLMTIKAPQLQSLILKEVKEHDLDSLCNSIDVTRFASLRRLTFSDFDLSTAAYERVSRTFKEITSLSIFRSTLADSPLVSLMLGGVIQGQHGPYVPWPKLQVLCFSFNSYHSYSKDKKAIEDMEKMREVVGQCPLDKIFLRVNSDDEDEDEKSGVTRVGKNIVVQFVSGEEAWPENSMDLDFDDNLFP